MSAIQEEKAVVKIKKRKIRKEPSVNPPLVLPKPWPIESPFTYTITIGKLSWTIERIFYNDTNYDESLPRFWGKVKNFTIHEFIIESSLIFEDFVHSVNFRFDLNSNQVHKDFYYASEYELKKKYGEDTFDNKILNDWLIEQMKVYLKHSQKTLSL